jgi:hypothetical protein
MILKTKKLLIIPVLFIVLVAALFLVQPVSADDGAPVDPVPAADAAPPTEEMGLVTEPEIPVAVPEVAPAAAVTEEPAVLPPEEAIPLVSRSSGNLVIEGDPHFAVGTAQYTFLNLDGTCVGVVGHCELSATPITAALDYMAAHSLTPTDRKLYIEPDTYDEDVEVDGDLPGVSGLTGLVGEGTAPEEVQIYGDMYIYNMDYGFQVKNLSVTNTAYTNDAAIWTWDNRGTLKLEDVNAQATQQDSSGIVISHTGTVILNRVNANGNGYMGAEIDNNGPITVMNSAFDSNGDSILDGYGGSEEPYYVGLVVNEMGTGSVLVNGVSANWNEGDGINVYAPLATITVKNSEFSENDPGHIIADWGDGMWIIANTAILENIYANNNDMRGIKAAINTSFTGTRLFTTGNFSTGINVDSCAGWTPEQPYCHNTGAGTVTIKGTASQGNGTWDEVGDPTNSAAGIYVYAKGTITISDVYSQGNTGDGYYLENDTVLVAAPVIVTMATSMENNGTGLVIFTKGAVTGTNVVANNNDGAGVYIEAYGPGAVTFTINPINPILFNETAFNGGDGYFIFSRGAVSLTSFDTYNNGNMGGHIDNGEAASALPVTIKVLNSLVSSTGAWENGNGGIEIQSRGLVTLSDFAATNNQAFGAYINNMPPSGLTGPAVIISNSRFSWNCGHDDKGCYWSGDPDQYGLMVESKGAITLLNVSADGNYGVGAYLDNGWTGATGGVNINAGTYNTNSFSQNGGEYGLDIQSNGLVSVTNLKVNWNAGTGAEILNDEPGSTAGVTIKATGGLGNSFYENYGGDGLYLYSNGLVSITNVNANRNNSAGVYIDNSGGTAAVTIAQVGSWNYEPEGYAGGNTFNNNGSYGVYLNTRGIVTLAFWQVRENDSDGIDVFGDTGAVTISGLASDRYNNVSSNYVAGIYVDTEGNITLNNIESRSNGHDGAFLDNNDGLGNVTINYGYFDSNNFGFTFGIPCGLCVYTNGAVVWKEGSASGNFMNGADINNYDDILPAKPVTLTNVRTTDNGETGLSIITKGVVLLTNVESNTNSANYYWLGMNDQWQDNLSYDQTWYFTAPGSGEVTIKVTVYENRWNPKIMVFDEYSNLVAEVSGSDSAATLTTAALTSGNMYRIYVESDQWPGLPYEINIYEGTTPPGSFYEYESQANGIFVDNSTGVNAAVSLLNPASHPWTSNNSDTDVVILTSGAVTITNTDLNDSRFMGLLVDNTYSTLTPGITLTNVNFNNNGSFGSVLLSRGAVTVKDSSSTSNRGEFASGYLVNNTSGPALAPVSFTNIYIDSNSENGIYIESDGAVTLNGFESRNNGQTGIEIVAGGAVTVTNVNSIGNGNFGVKVDTPNAFTIASTGSYSRFIGNAESGLYIEADGKVTITRALILRNGTWDEFGPTNTASGAEIYVSNPLGTSAVTMNYITAFNNTANGIFIDTTGAVSLTDLQANNNRYYGVAINQNDAPSSLFPITLTRFEVSNNGGGESCDGLNIVGNGNITLSKFTVWNNGKNGILLNNTNGTGTITILNPAGGYSSNMAGGNVGAGVEIHTNGVVNITGLEVAYNQHHGLYVDNLGSTLMATVTINNVLARDNSLDGFAVDSKGVVTVNNSWFVQNLWAGIEAHTPRNMFINNSVAIKNSLMGLYIDLLPSGDLTLNNSTWYGNLRDDPDPADRNLMFYGDDLIII